MNGKTIPSLLCIAATAAAAQPALALDKASGAWSFHHENVLGTSLNLTIRAENHAQALQAEAALLATIDRANETLSAWNPNSELSRWMATRGTAEPVSPQLLETLALFDHWRTQTDGALDASVQTAVKMWRSATAEGRTPSESEVSQAVEAMQQKHWELDLDNGTATRLTDSPLVLASFAKSMISSQAADAALAAGATGVMLNVGGDVVVRGILSQVVDIADPTADAENDRPIDRVVVKDRAVATSGSYRRGFDTKQTLGSPQFSHIIDPRTAMPAGHIASSTVIAKDATTAGALATALSVVSPTERTELTARYQDAAYMIVQHDGQRLASANWSDYQTPLVKPAMYAAAMGAPAPAVNENFELAVQLDLARIDDPRYRKPYVAVWIEDKDRFPLRTVALWWDGKGRFLPEMKAWYHDDRVRNMAEGTDITRTVSSATRPPGSYTVKWDGKDSEGKAVPAGKYTVCVEIAREHGGYEIFRQELDFNGKPQQLKMGTGGEGSATVDYRKR